MCGASLKWMCQITEVLMTFISYRYKYCFKHCLTDYSLWFAILRLNLLTTQNRVSLRKWCHNECFHQRWCHDNKKFFLLNLTLIDGQVFYSCVILKVMWSRSLTVAIYTQKIRLDERHNNILFNLRLSRSETKLKIHLTINPITN